MSEIKGITLMGMSGVGKTHLCRLFDKQECFHYSADFRIATHYLKENMTIWLTKLAMQNSELAYLLRHDLIGFEHKISIDNLRLMSAYIGKLGCDGLPLSLFLQRQREYAKAEYQAMCEVPDFIKRVQELYGCRFFLNDSTGSLCELERADEVVEMLAAHTLPVYLHADSELEEELIRRTFAYPKPMCYREDFLQEQISAYLKKQGVDHIDEVSSDDFIRFVFPQLIEARRIRYLDLAKRYGVIVPAKEAMRVHDADEFLQLIRQYGENLCL